jgi:hypothetical protein
MADFYKMHFGYSVHREPDDRIVELRPPGTGAILLLLPAAKSKRAGQSAVKLVFACNDVETFGALHRGDGYVFANAKDPSWNAISISGRIITV